jgi:hypothetical protein
VSLLFLPRSTLLLFEVERVEPTHEAKGGEKRGQRGRRRFFFCCVAFFFSELEEANGAAELPKPSEPLFPLQREGEKVESS